LSNPQRERGELAQLKDLIRPEVRLVAPYNSGMTLSAIAERYAPDRIAKLGSNENPLGPSAAVARALAFGGDLLRFYPDPRGMTLCRALALHHAISPEQIILGNGSEDLIAVIARTVIRSGDRVATLYPSFALHEDYALALGATIIRVALRADLSLDVDRLVEVARSGPRLLIFSNPMNPAGCWLSPSDMRRVIDATPEGCLLVVDEAYFEYAEGPDYADSIALLGAADRPWIVLRTFSKAWGLAGLRIGYGVVGSAALREILDLMRTPFNVNSVAQAAALAALSDLGHLRNVVSLARSERERLFAHLHGWGLRVLPSKGNFLFFDCGQTATQFVEGLLAQGVIVKPWKQEGYTQFIRVTIGSVAENDHFLAALQSCLAGTGASIT